MLLRSLGLGPGRFVQCTVRSSYLVRIGPYPGRTTMTSTTMTTTMRAVTQDRYGDAEVLRVTEVARPDGGRPRGAGPGERGRSRPRHAAPDDRHPVCGAARPRAASTAAAHLRARRGRDGRAGGFGGDPVRRRRRGVRHGRRVVRRVRRGPGGQAGPQAGHPVLRPGRRGAHLGRHGAAGARRRGARAGRSVGARSSVPPAGSGRMRSSWPRRSVPTSPACAARPSSTW